MNLKESYRYANYLSNLLDTAYGYLRTNRFVTTTKQNHLRKKVNIDAADEVIEVPKSYDVDFNANNVIDFVVRLIDEKEKLSQAITKAKATTEINIDSAVSMNKTKLEFISVLNTMVAIKPSNAIVQGSDYKFNSDGNQVKYVYNIEQSVSIDFDRNDVKGLIKKYNKMCDEVSAKLDEIEINTVVEFDPLFDLSDDFEDLVTSTK